MNLFEKKYIKLQKQKEANAIKKAKRKERNKQRLKEYYKMKYEFSLIDHITKYPLGGK